MKKITATPELLTSEEAAELLRVSPRSLNNMRSRGGGPPYVKLGRLVRYDRRRLAAWIEARVRTSTADQGEHRRG